MSKHLKNDLDKLEQRLLALGGRVETAVRRSIAALVSRRPDLAQGVRQGDLLIDREEVELEEECLKVLALHQPVAGDLRFVTACLKINNDLERIGDLAVNIAERAASIGRTSPMAVPEHIDGMTECVTSMLREALDAFVQGDTGKARGVMAQDDEVDRMNRDTIIQMVDKMKAGAGEVDDALLYLSASKNLERIADHATNIAEDVIYLVDGEIVRHQGTIQAG